MIQVVSMNETINIYKDFKFTDSETRAFTRDIVDLAVGEYYVPTEEEILESLVNQWNMSGKQAKKVFSKMAAFMELYKYTRTTNGCSILPIATTDKRLVNIFGTPKSVSRAIKKLLDIGLIEIENDKYHFTNEELRRRGYSYSRTYRYKYEVEVVFKKFLDEKHIQVYQWKNVNEKALKIESLIKYIDPKQVVISSKLAINVDRSKADFENTITSLLYQNYPQLVEYQRKADYINSTYYKDLPDLQTVFQPHFTYNKDNTLLRKIGIRATNRVVSAKKDAEIMNPEFKGIYKKDVLELYGVHEYDNSDVCASVPRLTKSIARGEWVSQDVDIYEQIKNVYQRNLAMTVNKEDYSFLAGRETTELEDKELRSTVLCLFNEAKNTEWKKYRKDFKSLFMRGYFDTAKLMGGHMKSILFHDKRYRPFGLSIETFAKMYRTAIETTLGANFDSEIFLHESCIYMDVLEELLKRGLKVVQIYDSWYTDKEVEDMEEIIESKFQAYYDKYIKEETEEESVLATTLSEEEEKLPQVKESFAASKLVYADTEGNVVEKREGSKRKVVRSKEDYEIIERSKGREDKVKQRLVIRSDGRTDGLGLTLVDSLGQTTDLSAKISELRRIIVQQQAQNS